MKLFSITLRKILPPANLYILPALLFMFVVNYHYFSFYLSEFKSHLSYTKPSLNKNQYAIVQSQHPYFEIYKLAQQYKNDLAVNVVYLFDKRNEKNFDYTSTYYEQQTNHSKKKMYLSELGIMINYFFYPRIVRTYSYDEFLILNLKQSDIVISDYRYYPDLEPIVSVKDEFNAINKLKKDSFIVYRIQ